MFDRRATNRRRLARCALILAAAASAGIAGEPETASWIPPPSRRALDPNFRFHPSPQDWRDIPIYQIVTDRFADGDPANNLANREAVFNPYGPDSLHGGDFEGIRAHLDYIQGLGMKALWISPVCLNEQGRYHGYAAWDFNRVDPHWGSLEDLRALIDAAHARGIYVILDIVFNHMAGIVRSAHPDWPRFQNEEYALEWRWPDHIPPAPFDRLSRFHGHGDIADWKDPHQVLVGSFSGLADLRTSDPEVRRDLVRIYSAWIEATDCDGFRVDSVRHTEGEFFDEVLSALRANAAALGKTRFLIAGEVWSSRQEVTVPYTGADRFHSLLDFPLRRVLQRVFFEDESISALPAHLAGLTEYPTVARDQLVTFLDNHDNPRLLHALARPQPEARMGAALAYQFTQGQIPCLYYGTEQGFAGGNDPANREDFFHGEFEQGPSVGDNFNAAHPLYRWVRRLNLLREAYPELRRGTHHPLTSPAEGRGLYAFARAHGQDVALVAVNNAAASATAEVSLATSPLSGQGVWVNVLQGNETVEASNDAVRVTLPAWGSAVFVPRQRVQPLPPSVVSVTPAHGATAPENLDGIRIAFDQPMDTAGTSNFLRIDPPLEYTAQWNGEGTEVRLHLAAGSPPPGEYEILGSGAWPAKSGRTLGSDAVVQFRVGLPAEGARPLGPFAMDGRLDAGVPAVGSNGEAKLYAAFDAASGAFYVAGPAAKDGFDHFILVTDALLDSASAPAPWGKSGFVAAEAPFLADENDNEFHAWRRVNGRASSSSGEVLEGVFNLADHFGRIPEAVFVAFAAYGTTEKGRLDPTRCIPPVGAEEENLTPEAYLRIQLREAGGVDHTTPRQAPDPGG